MYNSIVFTTLHIHAGQEGHTHTLSKTLAVYSNDLFKFSNDELFESSSEIKSTIFEHAQHALGHDSELFQHFVWHLN